MAPSPKAPLHDPEHAPSWYAATAHPQPGLSALAGDVRCDAVVIGGGLTGVTAALELAERGFDTVLLEARRIGWGASGRNGGQIGTGYSPPMALLARLAGEAGARDLWAMAEEAKALLYGRIARHGIDCDLVPGQLIAAVKRRHLAELADTLAEWQAYGYEEARLLDRDETLARVACPAYLGGLHDPGAGHLHTLNYVLGLAEAARAAGARLFEGSEVLRLEPGGSVTAHTAGGRVRAGFAILAGNAYLSRIAPEAERAVRGYVMPVGTYVLATEPLGADRAQALIPGNDAVCDTNWVLNYYRRTPDGRMLFGGGASYTTLRPFDVTHRLKRAMTHYFPGLKDARVDHCWGGHVAITRNRAPHFGRLAPNVLFAQGFSGQGVALTGLAGRLMAEAAAGTAERFDVFARLPHKPFPGGRLFRRPALVLATTWLRVRDLV